jgi:hypothetical protein
MLTVSDNHIVLGGGGGGGGGGGDVVGAASSTDNAVVRFNGTTGKLVQNSGVVINDVVVPLKPSLNNNLTSIDAVDFINTRGIRAGFHLSEYSNTAADSPVFGTGSLYLSPWGNALTLTCNLNYEYVGDSFTSTKFTVEPGSFNTTGGMLRYSANAGVGGTSGTWELAASGPSTGIGTVAALQRLLTARIGSIVFSPSASTSNDLNITTTGLGIGVVPTAKLDINSDALRLRTAKTPATSTSVGNQGDMCWDANYIYVCIATNTWKRTAIATW